MRPEEVRSRWHDALPPRPTRGAAVNEARLQQVVKDLAAPLDDGVERTWTNGRIAHGQSGTSAQLEVAWSAVCICSERNPPPGRANHVHLVLEP